jgi:single-strand DNA-binding protein
MNKAILMGRLTRDPEVKNADDLNKMVAKYTLAVTRSWSNNGKEEVDFIPCVAFNKAAEFASKFLKRGLKIVIIGRLQTGSYTNKDGQKVFTMDVIVDEQEFTTPKSSNTSSNANVSEETSGSNMLLSDELSIN